MANLTQTALGRVDPLVSSFSGHLDRAALPPEQGHYFLAVSSGIGMASPAGNYKGGVEGTSGLNASDLDHIRNVNCDYEFSF